MPGSRGSQPQCPCGPVLPLAFSSSENPTGAKQGLVRHQVMLGEKRGTSLPANDLSHLSKVLNVSGFVLYYDPPRTCPVGPCGFFQVDHQRRRLNRLKRRSPFDPWICRSLCVPPAGCWAEL